MSHFADFGTPRAARTQAVCGAGSGAAAPPGAADEEVMMRNESQIEALAALEENCREAEALGDRAAARAFEDELHARVTLAEIRGLEALDPATGEPSPAETDRLRGALEEIWSNASARLD